MNIPAKKATNFKEFSETNEQLISLCQRFGTEICEKTYRALHVYLKTTQIELTTNERLSFMLPALATGVVIDGQQAVLTPKRAGPPVFILSYQSLLDLCAKKLGRRPSFKKYYMAQLVENNIIDPEFNQTLPLLAKDGVKDFFSRVIPEIPQIIQFGVSDECYLNVTKAQMDVKTAEVRGRTSAWKKYPEEMYLKTAAKAFCKWHLLQFDELAKFIYNEEEDHPGF